MTITGPYKNGRPITLTVENLQEIVDCLLQWQSAAWAGDAYEYCNASNERDRILDKLLGEGTAPSGTTNSPQGQITKEI